MKRIFALLVAIVLCLSACSTVRETPKATEYVDEELMQEVDLTPRIVINPVLYFLNEAQTRLATEAREIAIPQNSVAEKYVIEALLEGPESDTLYPVADGFGLERLEIMPDVINVYLNTDAKKSEDAITNAKMAIAATLSDFSGNRYTNIFINGTQTGYKGEPTGVFQKSVSDLSEERKTIEGTAQADSPETTAVLYYLNSTEELLLPETRRLRFQDKDYISVLLEELIRGPENTYNHMPVIDSSIQLLRSEVVEENGSNIAKLHFNREPRVATESFVDGNKMALAAITYTVMSFIPDLAGVQIYVNDTKTQDTIYTMNQYESLIGSDILLYLPNGVNSVLLTPLNRVILQGQAHLPEVVLRELMKGPSDAEDSEKYPAVPEVYPAMPDGISYEDVNEVYVANDILVIDFASDIQEKMSGLKEENEFIMLYSIVNTMASQEGIRRVQFLIDGERVERLGDGLIDVIDPIMKNPGIIR